MAPVADRLQRHPLLRLFLGYVVLPNAVFAVFDHFWFSTRALVNVDYLLVALLAPLLRPTLTMAAMFLLFCTDVTVTVGTAYHFTPADAVASVGQLFRLNFFATAPLWVVALGSALLVAFAAQRIAEPRRASSSRTSFRLRALLVTAGCALSLLDIANGTGPGAGDRGPVVSANIATSGLVTVTRTLKERIEPAPLPTPMPAATERLRADVAAGRLPPATHNVVVVVVESWGILRDSSLNARVARSLLAQQVAERYDVARGRMKTVGATTSGELRELCWMRMNYLSLKRGTVTDCLPRELHRAGFTSIAFHGYTGALFNRTRWYPQLGFDSVFFGPSMWVNKNMERCGSMFRGVCDADIAQRIGRSLEGAHGKFIYWMTLNSHLPVEERISNHSTMSCDGTAVEQFDDVCGQARAVEATLSELAHIIVRAPATRFVIVGDHPPPFASPAKRALFVENTVPFYELSPRSP